MKWLVGLCLCLISFLGKAQSYSAALIPDSLKENADVVKRFEEIKVIIKSNSKAIVQRKYVITVLNQNGDDWATYYNGYTKMISLSDISGKLYDAGGTLIKSIKKKDITDLSVSDDVSILSDARSKSFSFYHKVYPYTVEFEDEQVYDGLFFLPKWIPFSDSKMSVIQSRFEVETPIDYQIRYKQFNYHAEPSVSKGKSIIYSWAIKNQQPVEFEPLSPSWRSIVPAVFIAASDFELGEYKGNMSTWKSFGLFIKSLNAGKDLLTENINQYVIDLTKNQNSIRDKVETLYQYMQKNTRYISIQLGIGSWQPFDAKYVAINKYGDCKALSNYMISLLKAAGVKANYVLIEAGDNARGLYEDFPAPNFNHAIVCVPNGKDSIWLECTSQTVAPGYLGTFTGNRNALLIDDDGGHVVHTPRFSPEENLQIRMVTGVVDGKGDLNVSVKTRFTGEQQELQHQLIHDATPEERKRYLNQVISLPTYKVNHSSYSESRNRIPEIVEELEIESPAFATVSSKRLFITPNLFNKSASKLPDLADRKYPVLLKQNYLDIDTVKISFPQEYTLESMPKSIAVQSEFGEYSIDFLLKQNLIEMVRKFKRIQALLPKERYVEVQKFLETVRKADNSRLVLVKKE